MTESTKRRRRDVFRDLLPRREKTASSLTSSPHWQSSIPSSIQTASSPQLPPSQTSRSSPSTQTGCQFSEEALGTLAPADQALVRRLLAENANDITNTVQQAYEAARKQRQVCDEKRWRVNFRGRELVLRDEADRVVCWIQRFKSVGDVAANADPIHVGLPWAGIRMILEVAMAGSRQTAVLLSGMNLAMYMANRLNVYWNSFIRLPDTPTTATFEKALIKMYAIVLRFFDSAVETYRKGSAMRTWTSLWKESELNTFESKCKDWAVQVEIDASNCDRELYQHDRDGVSKWREDLEKTLERLEDHVASRKPIERNEESSPPTITVPFLRDPDFVDRVELNTLTQKLSTGGARVALVGLGGVGKSQLAIEYCYRARERSADLWVLWVHASNAARFEEGLRKIADDKKIPGRKDAQVNIYQLVYDWLRDVKRGEWLLVLDNADDADFLFEPSDSDGKPAQDGRSERVTKSRTRLDYLPICAHGSILVTSRKRTIVSKMVDEHSTVTVKPMDSEHALALLEKKLGRQDDPTLLQRLATTLEHMPLAITQAAAYIKQRAPRCTVEQYLDKFEKSESSRTSLLDTNSAELRRDREASNSVMLTWQISFEHIHEFRRSAADLLSLMSFFDHQNIPESLLRVKLPDEPASVQHTSDDADDAGEDDAEEAFEDDILTLRDYHFVSVIPETNAFGMHRLVQLAARKWLKSQTQYQRYAEQSVRNLNLALPDGEYEDWDTCRNLYPHAKMALELKLEDETASLRWASVLYKAARFALNRGLLQEAETLARSSTDARMRLLGADNEYTMLSESNLASMLAAQGNYKTAEQMDRRVLERMEKVLGKEHPETLASVNNLGISLLYQGKYKAAEEMLRRALEGSEKVLGKEHPKTLASVNDLGVSLSYQGRYEAAEEMFRRALEVSEKVLGKDHPKTLGSVNNLGISLLYQGKYKAAEEMLRRALEGSEKVLGKDHPETLGIVNNLGMSLLYQGKYEAAEEMLRRALEGREKVLGKEHPDTLTGVNNFALLLREKVGYEAAEEMNRRAVEGLTKVLGKEHPTTLASVDDLVNLLRLQDKHEAADELDALYYSASED